MDNKSPMDNMVYSPSTNLVDAVIDEIALEGLDGITLEALWQRLAQRLQITDDFPQPMKEQIWTICVSVKELTFYQLESPRKPLIIYDRYEFVDPDLGTISEPDNVPDDIYEHFPIDDVKNAIRGSCKSYHTRKRIDSAELTSLELAETRYGQTLVIVGSQSLRRSALMEDTVSPTLELNVLQYCFLERVGRSRYHGEVTQGKRSLSLLKEDPKSLFYYRKYLLKHKLITKQTHYQRNSGHGTSGSLLHLPRFFVERKPKMIFLAERIIEILKARENGLVDYDEIKTELQIENSIKYLLKTAIFQKVVKSDLSVPYRMLYPHANSSEWQRKNCPAKEKKIRALQLIDPNIDVNDLWNKDEPFDEEESYELDVSHQKINEPLLKQANIIVEEASYDGLSQSELAVKMGVTKLSARTIFRNLSKCDLVATYMNDMGRQRITKYVSKRFEKNSNISKQFQTEMNKMKELTKTSSLQNMSETIPTSRESSVLASDTAEKIVTQKTPMEVEGPKELSANRRDLFTAVNKIMKKYNLKKYLRPYKVTFQNVAEMDGLSDQLEKLSSQMDKLPGRHIELVNSTDGNDTTGNYRVILHENEASSDSSGGLRSLMKNSNNLDSKNPNIVTYRILKRANMIIEAVNDHQVIDDLTKLMRMINEEEEREGYDVKIDKKSLIRILQKLAMDNLIQLFKLSVIANGKEKLLTFICDPSINVNHAVIQSAIEQTKIKLCLMRSHKRKPFSKRAEKGSTKRSRKQLSSDLDSKEHLFGTFDAKVLRPKSNSKFIQMEVVHKLLYYLIYDHPGQSPLTKAQHIEKLRTEGLQIDDEMEKEMAEIYTTQVDWRMFISSLPTHCGWPTGWAMLCDILLRIPLSIFLKIYKFSLPELDYYKEHPIRQHYLVKDLPTPVRNVLLMKRLYIASIYEIITKLCHVGLVQFGPQKLKDKDQVFLYLNRHSELMDTTSSAAGYHKIEDKEYPVTKYFFDKTEVVNEYWFDMRQICIYTQLGRRLAVQGKNIIIENPKTKPMMIKTLKPRSAKEAPLLDLGIMPGDKKGAAGIDSSLFPHLKKNWNWENFKNSNSNQSDIDKREAAHPERNSKLSKIEAKPLKFTDFTGLRKITGPTTVDAEELKENTQQQKLTSIGAVDAMLRWELLENTDPQRQNVTIRHVKPRKPKQRIRVKYDEVDRTALQRMYKRRVDWDAPEDNILLVCKVVMMYLCPHKRSQPITFSAVRDILHSYSRSSCDKTSRACQRRVMWLMKQDQTRQSVEVGVDEIRQNYYVNKRYGDIIHRIRKNNPPSEQDAKITAVFKDLVAYVAKKYYAILQIDLNECQHKPHTVEEFNLVYEVNHPQKGRNNQGFTHDVRSINEIHIATINSVIYSSLHCDNDGKQWGYQRFRIYQQYPETLLQKAMNKTRSDQMISVKKSYVVVMRKNSNCMPMNSSHHQLSTNYIFKFHTKLPFELYSEMQTFYSNIIQGYKNNVLGAAGGVEVLPPTGGIIVGIQELLAQGKLDFNIEIPDHVITLEPKPNEPDENYTMVEKRYQDILTCVEQGKTPESPKNPDQQEDLEPSEAMDVEETTKETAEETVEEAAEVPPATETINVPNEQIGKSTQTNKEYWAWDHNLESDKSEDEDDNEYIQLQDGTMITITRDDIECSRATRVDDSIHKAFLRTRNESLHDFRACSSIHRLNQLVQENISAMDVNAMRTQEAEEVQIKMEISCEPIDDESTTPYESPKLSNFVNDIIATMDNEIQSQPVSCQKVEDSIDAHKRSSRIALLRMREEFNESLEDSHHAHKYFVVSTFGIFYSLPEIDEERRKNPDFVIDDQIANKLLSLSDEAYNRIVNDLNEFALFPMDFPDYLRMRQYLVYKLSNIEPEQIDRVYEYVRDKREQGATLPELVKIFYKRLGNEMYDILFTMTDRRLFLRSGVTEVHYIHHSYVNPWTIHSIKITRRQREALPVFPQGSVYVLNKKRNQNSADSSDITENNSTGENFETINNENNADESISPKNRASSSRTREPPVPTEKSADIIVVIRPWIQIDGLINRNTLEKMLGSVLAHCVLHPGIALTQVQARFVPALQPYHTRELVEMLVKLECLQLKVLHKSTSTLISKASSTKLCYPVRNDSTSEYDHELIVESVVGATLKFGAFFQRYHPRKQSSDPTDHNS